MLLCLQGAAKGLDIFPVSPSPYQLFGGKILDPSIWHLFPQVSEVVLRGCIFCKISFLEAGPLKGPWGQIRQGPMGGRATILVTKLMDPDGCVDFQDWDL